MYNLYRKSWLYLKSHILENIMSEYFYVDILRCLKEIYSSYLSVHTVPGTKLPQKVLLLVKIEEGDAQDFPQLCPNAEVGEDGQLKAIMMFLNL